jgi:hypothetical protein
MSKLVNIGSSVYEFDLSLTRVVKDEYSFIPISKAIVLYLEIEDNLANFGVQGKVVFNNFFGILDKLGLGRGVNQGITLFDINFKNKDFQDNVSIVDKSLQLVVQLGLGDDDSKNPVDKNLTYDFEEYVVRLLRERKVDPRKISSNTQLTQVIQELITTCIDKDGVNLYVREEDFDKSSDLVVPLTQVIKPMQSYYDLIRILYKYLWYDEVESPGLLQLENFELAEDKNKIQRRFTMKPLFKLIKEFSTKLENNDINLQDYVSETFVIGEPDGTKTNPILRENTIEQYTVSEADLDKLLLSTWTNHKITYMVDDNITDVTNELIKYSDLRELFKRAALNTQQDINVPRDQTENYSDDNDTNLVTPEYICDFKEKGDAGVKIIKAGIQSMVTRSFIFDNSAITFRTTGSPYRNPGTFILINDDNTPDGKESPTGYWFVISVKHIFENEIYQNEITAVKFYNKLKIPVMQDYNV